MKMTDRDFSALSEMVSKYDTEEARDLYRRNMFPRAEACTDKNKRYRWDCLYEAVAAVASDPYPDYMNGLYRYLNDDHIDTALRAIVSPL